MSDTENEDKADAADEPEEEEEEEEDNRRALLYAALSVEAKALLGGIHGKLCRAAVVKTMRRVLHKRLFA